MDQITFLREWTLIVFPTFSDYDQNINRNLENVEALTKKYLNDEEPHSVRIMKKSGANNQEEEIMGLRLMKRFSTFTPINKILNRGLRAVNFYPNVEPSSQTTSRPQYDGPVKVPLNIPDPNAETSIGIRVMRRLLGRALDKSGINKMHFYRNPARQNLPVEEDPTMALRVMKNDPSMNVRVMRNDPTMNVRVMRNDPSMNVRVMRNDPSMNVRVMRADPIGIRVMRRSPKDDKTSEAYMTLRTMRGDPAMGVRVM